MSAGAKLARALIAMARASGCAVRTGATSERPWASATFTGACHAIAIEAQPSPALDAWLDSLPEAEFAVPGHVVADVAVSRGAAGTTIAALMLEAA
jgi:hypothetical protein